MKIALSVNISSFYNRYNFVTAQMAIMELLFSIQEGKHKFLKVKSNNMCKNVAQGERDPRISVIMTRCSACLNVIIVSPKEKYNQKQLWILNDVLFNAFHEIRYSSAVIYKCGYIYSADTYSIICNRALKMH